MFWIYSWGRASLFAMAGLLAGCGTTGFAPHVAITSSAGLDSPQTASYGRSRSITLYRVVKLRSLGGDSASANGINDRGWIFGTSALAGDYTINGELWRNGRKSGLGTLGGPESAVTWPVKDDRDEVAGASSLSQTDPLAEHFCGFASYDLCNGFRWKARQMTALGTIGGNNSYAAGENNTGQIAGIAETAVQDRNCAAPQVFDYDAVIWDAHGHVTTLPPLAGDAVSQAVAINSHGAAAGASGPCGSPLTESSGSAHALLWRSGSPIDLGSLGGTQGNDATAINDRGDVAGFSALAGNSTLHAFRWQRGTIHDLGVLAGDQQSLAFGMNNQGQIVGQSCDASYLCRGFVWQHGSMSDLNSLVARTQLYIIYAGDINDDGSIVGEAVNPRTGEAPAVLLLPYDSARAAPASPKPKLPFALLRALAHSVAFRHIVR